ncbi:CidA/LrgA family protein [Clostridium sp.]|uniref:CidA/LrgA family protein n=1 Tax=Clostridium sp. TaxID=1506 RepID=UPI002FDE3E0A
MKYLRQLMIILIMCFLGQLLEKICLIPIPGVVIGLILLFLSLCAGIIKIEMVEDISNVLLSHMSFLFIPAGVGLMVSFNILKGKWVLFMFIVGISTIIVWIVTFYIVLLLRKVHLNE